MERDDELRTLSGIASEGDVSLVVITGEAGTGKSRLAREFTAALAGLLGSDHAYAGGGPERLAAE